MFPEQVDLLVVGAGPGGSAAAIRAARLGLRVLAVDRARFPRDKACSEYLSPDGVRHLAELGVLERLDRAGGHALAGTTVVGPNGGRLTGLFARTGATLLRPTGLSLARRVLDATLVDAAREVGASVLEGATLVELLYDGGAVAGGVLRLPDGTIRRVRAPLVIGADGLRSVVARRLGKRRHGFPGRIAFVAHVADVARLGAVAEMHVGREGYVGVNPIGGGLANVALVVPRALAQEARGDPAAFFYKKVEGFPGLQGRVDRSKERRRVMVTGPFAARSSVVTAPGALLLGDAAEFFDPFTGEGIHSALVGAELALTAVGGALARTGAVPAAALAEYRARRRERFAGSRIVERLVGWGMHLPALFDRAVRNLGARDLGHIFIGVTGDLLPARDVLTPGFLYRMMV